MLLGERDAGSSKDGFPDGGGERREVRSAAREGRGGASESEGDATRRRNQSSHLGSVAVGLRRGDGGEDGGDKARIEL